MLHKLTPSDKLFALADYILQDTEHTFDMGSGAHCAYAFCARMHGESIERGKSDTEHFARMIGCDLDTAQSIYFSAGLASDRRATAALLRRVAKQIHHTVQLPVQA